MKSHFDKPVVRFTISTSNFPIFPVAVSKCFDFSGFDLITPILKVRSPLRTLQNYRYYSQIEIQDAYSQSYADGINDSNSKINDNIGDNNNKMIIMVIITTK